MYVYLHNQKDALSLLRLADEIKGEHVSNPHSFLNGSIYK